MKSSGEKDPVKSMGLGSHSAFSTSSISLPPRCPSSKPSEHDTRIDSAESVYSSSSYGVGGNGYAVVAGEHDKVFTRNIPENIQKLQHPLRRSASNASSIEWKTWLSANVEKLGVDPQVTSKSLPRQEDTPHSTTHSESHVHKIGCGINASGHDAVLQLAGNDLSGELSLCGPDISESGPPPIPLRSLLRTSSPLCSKEPRSSHNVTGPNISTQFRNTWTSQSRMNEAQKKTADSHSELGTPRSLCGRGKSQFSAPSTVSSPGMTAAVDRIFGPAQTRSSPASSHKVVTNENHPIGVTLGRNNQDSNKPAEGLGRVVNVPAQARQDRNGVNSSTPPAPGGRQMADLLLSIRQRRVASNSDSVAFL